MKIRYDIKASIANKNNGTSSSFPPKTLETEVVAENDNLLYNNNHIIARDVYLFDIFKDEVQTYSNALGVPVIELEFDSFEVIGLAPPEKYQVYFEFDSEKQKQDLRPTIKVYIAPKNDLLERPILKGNTLDKNSILWSWDEAECSHYLVTEPIDPENPDDNDKIIVQLPIGVNEYTETLLKPGTSYTRRLIAYTNEQYSEVSSPCTVWTETSSPDTILNKYETPRLYDFTIDESQREVMEERMKAFQSGVGDFTDLQVYKQMDADFYQKFKAYFEITGRRLQRERRYEQVGFWYKVCLDAYERIQEQEGEVTFDVYAYPREWLRLQDYVWAVKDVQIQAEFEASVFLQRENSGEQEQQVEIYECTTEEVPDNIDETGTWVWTVEGTLGTPGTYETNGTGTYKYKIPDTPPVKKFIAESLGVLLVIDKTGSLVDIGREDELREAAKKCINDIWKVYTDLKDAGANVTKPLFGVVAFAERVEDLNREPKPMVWIEPGNDEEDNKKKAEKAINDIVFDGDYTNWIAGINKASEILLANTSDRKFVVLFFSDGGANKPDYSDEIGVSVLNYDLQWVVNPSNLHTQDIKNSANRLKNCSNCKLVIPIIFEYNWGHAAYHNTPLNITFEGQKLFADDAGGRMHCLYSQKYVHLAAESLVHGDGVNVIWWSNRDDGLDNIQSSFEKAFGYFVRDVPGVTGASGSKTGKSWAEIAADNAFVTKVNEAKTKSGKTDLIETAKFSVTGAYGWDPEPTTTQGTGNTLPSGATWITPPVSGTADETHSKSGLHAEESGSLPTLSSCTDIPAEYKPGGAHPGRWEPEPVFEERTKTVFNGWEESSENFDTVSKYNIDTVIKVKVHGGPYFYTFTNNVTPIKYSRKEKRAIVSKALSDDPANNYFTKSDGSKVMLLNEIKSLVEKTPEWASGYRTYVKTTSGKLMIEGLFIKDNYTIGDEDANYNRGWCNGMEGSVNAYTKINRGQSDSYGDDCYLVDENSVLQIQGYTDAMIYDGEHAVSAELNAYDYPHVNAIHSNGSVIVSDGVDIPCSTFMFNRANGENYNGSGPYNHCVDVVECDRDIILEGLNDLVQEEVNSEELQEEGGSGQNIVQRKLQKYQVFEPMTNDIIGKIDFWYRSPVLNYRFNLEDPDARTSIYEILPDCHPDDNYLHVVLLHVYYARNVYITDGPNPEMLNGTPQPTFNYVASYGNNPIAYYGDPNILDDNPNNAEGLYKWTKKMWQNSSFLDNGWYLDDFVWFQAEKMMKDIPYHNELPDKDMQPFYGLVNGRYTSKRQDGKQDLLVQVPQFNIPATVIDYYVYYGGSSVPINWNGDGTHPLKIYIVLTECRPKDALVEYKWDKDCRWVNPETGKLNDDITQDCKGCYATFSCDSITYKDVEYFDVVQTINFENQEVFDTKNNIIHYQIEKPETEYTYVNYYLKVSTDNSDVMPLNYPSEIMFDENNHSNFGVTYKGVVNATTKWSPRIHNGYYYLNQHEYFAYSEFAFDHERTNVEHNDLEKCITVFGHMVFDITLCHKAAPSEIYRGDNAVVKNTRSSLLQNEKEFEWVDGKGVTLKPTIDGEYYKEYKTYMYYSPVLSFPNILTTHGPVSIDFKIPMNSDTPSPATPPPLPSRQLATVLLPSVPSNFSTIPSGSCIEYKYGWYELGMKPNADKLRAAYTRIYNMLLNNGQEVNGSYKYSLTLYDHTVQNDIPLFIDRTKITVHRTPTSDPNIYKTRCDLPLPEDSQRKFMGIYLFDLELLEEEVDYVFNLVFDDCPELLIKFPIWNRPSYEGLFKLENGSYVPYGAKYVTCLTIRTFFKENVRQTMLQICVDTLNDINRIIDETYKIKFRNQIFSVNNQLYSPSDMVKIGKVIHDYLEVHNVYGRGDGHTLSQTMYPALSNGIWNPICASYARAFQYCCWRWGINAVKISGICDTNGDGQVEDDAGHAWNIVSYQNKTIHDIMYSSDCNEQWQEVDCTWDDSGPSSGYDYGNTKVEDIYMDYSAFTTNTQKTNGWNDSSTCAWDYFNISTEEINNNTPGVTGTSGGSGSRARRTNYQTLVNGTTRKYAYNGSTLYGGFESINNGTTSYTPPGSVDLGTGIDEIMNVDIRSYILEEGKWSDWYPLAGVEVPCKANTNYQIPSDIPLSHAYQLRFPLQASVTNTPERIEDYLCCYLDWKDDADESACYNIVTITDHMTTGPYSGKGVYVSKIFDFGCKTTVILDMFESNYNSKIKLYVASSIDKKDLYIENATWIDTSIMKDVCDRYIRYKIEIPEGEKLYWLHKRISTTKTTAIIPYIKGFTMEGEYHPQDVITNFINTEAFEITANNTYQALEEFSDLTRIIGDDVLDRDYTMDEIKKVDIRCTTDNISLHYNSNLLNEYPGDALKDTQLEAKAPYQTMTDVVYTPYIFLDNDTEHDKITIYNATPQQYCPITVEDVNGQTYIQLHECTDFKQTFKVVCKDKTKYIELPTNRYDYLTMSVKINGNTFDNSHYKITNHLIIFNDFLEIGDEIEVSYYIMYSFIAQIERYEKDNDPPNTIIYLYTGYKLNDNGEKEYISPAEKYKVFFETSLDNNKFTANNLSLNPIYRTDYKGFIYLTDDNNEPYTVKIYCNPKRIKAGGYDKVDVAVEVLDILGNPIINKEVYLDCGAVEDDDTTFDRGIINCDNNITDMNGVVHFIYESSVLPVEAKIRASVFNCAGASIEDIITIINE